MQQSDSASVSRYQLIRWTDASSPTFAMSVPCALQFGTNQRTRAAEADGNRSTAYFLIFVRMQRVRVWGGIRATWVYVFHANSERTLEAGTLTSSGPGL